MTHKRNGKQALQGRRERAAVRLREIIETGQTRGLWPGNKQQAEMDLASLQSKGVGQ